VGPANVQSPPAGNFGDKWGSDIAVTGGAVLVSAPSDDTAAGADSGSVTLFRTGEGNDLQVVGVMLPPGGGSPGDSTQGAGTSLETNGDIVVVGAPLTDVDGEIDRGSAIIYDLHAAMVGNFLPAGVYENAIGEAGDQFGASVGLSRARLLLGAPLSDEGPDLDEGRVDPFDLDGIFRGSFEF
jgi:hypothetical protein